MPERICGPPRVEGDASTGSDATNADASADASPLPLLVDRGLFFRYYIDEASSGTGPTALIDSAPAPLPLELDYGNGVLEFVETGGNRGLRWSSAGAPGAGATKVAGTKIEALDGAEQMSCEAVVDLVDVGPPFSRVLHLGVGGTFGDVSIFSDTGDTLSLGYDDTRLVTWQTPVLGARLVIHTVFDSSQNGGSQRLKLYINGSLVDNPSGNFPARGGQLTISNDGDFLIGNNPLVQRSFQGVIHYVACYTAALDDAEVANNAARLMFDDDRP